MNAMITDIATDGTITLETEYGRTYAVETDGSILVWDDIAGHFTRCHSLSAAKCDRIRAAAKREAEVMAR